MGRGIESHSGIVIIPLAQIERVEESLFLEQATIVELEFPVFVAPKKCKVLALGIAIDDETITGADTDSMTLQFQNKGDDGTGTDVMAEKAFVAGVNVAAFDHLDFGTISNADLEEGDVISLQKINVNNGLASPDLTVSVKFRIIPE